ncbi:MAG: dehydrogenase E1 component subunit alpha/beta [Bacteroidetes bacterium]|nr:dehydrogenase E1 component subunit alpha/beta [Bacteroidota bacterium]
MNFNRRNLNNEELLNIYKELLYPRIIEEKMLILLRQGKIGKWFSGIGQEAISVGATLALESDEYILPLHRNLGVFTSRKIPFKKLFAQWQGKKSGFTKGRDRSFHFGTNEYHIVGMISHLGAMLGVANGISTAHLLNNDKKISLVFSGDGGTSEGDFHEAMNVAAVWSLPVIFLIENNGYGLSTPSNEQFKCKQFIDKGIGYGMEAYQVDGNNILEVYHKVNELANSMRNTPRPILLECMTFRMRGHEEASGTKYVPQELFDEWGKKDPISNYEKFLFDEGVLNDTLKQQVYDELKSGMDEDLAEVFAEPEIVADTDEELNDVYAPYTQILTNPATNNVSDKRLVDAISDGLRQSMERFGNTVVMGQDVAEYGGVFKITENFYKMFGKARVRNTPITESSILGAGYGLAIKGYKAIVEMQFSDFVSCGFNQIVNNLAKSHYRWAQAADVVVRMPTGAGVGAGPFHSQSTEAWFFHVPGLKIVYPSNPYDAKGLLCASIEDPNPVMFFEHKALYRSIEAQVPDDYYTLEIGKALTVQSGDELSIITYGWGVQWAIEACKQLDLRAEIVDLRTLLPWDKEKVRAAVAKTGKVLVLHEDTMIGGIGGEIAAWIGEHCFENLDAPVKRVASLDTPVPLAKDLEDNFLARKRLNAALEDLRNW